MIVVVVVVVVVVVEESQGLEPMISLKYCAVTRPSGEFCFQLDRGLARSR